MSSSEFANYAVHSCGCSIQQNGSADVIRLINPATGGKWNLNITSRLKSEIIERACAKLGIELPSNYGN